MLAKLRASLNECAGDVVFGMEDGTVSIFGLVLGVSASTSDRKAILVAGCSGACAAAVSMMAGAYLEAKTDDALGRPTASPSVRAMWMLASDFFAAAIPIAPFAILGISTARFVSIGFTAMLLAALGFWRSRLTGEAPHRTIAETLIIGSGAGLAGVLIGFLISAAFR